MKPLHPLPPAAAATTSLAPTQTVLALQCQAGQHAVLVVLAGRVWLTRSGHPDDHFLKAGQRLEVQGPATLYASAEDAQPVRLRWELRQGMQQCGQAVPA